MALRLDQSDFQRQLRGALDSAGIRDSVVRALRLGAVDVQGDVVRSIQQSPPTGETYRRGAVTHTASSPGNPPRTDTGRLVQSARVEPKSDGADVVVASSYAKPLEYGTRNMAPRPFLGPAAEKNADQLTERVRAAVSGAWER